MQLIDHATPLDFLRSWRKKDGPRIAVFDIETFPMLSYHWRMWKQNIASQAVLHDVSLMSFAVKWLGQPDSFYADVGGRGVNRIRDHKPALKKLHRILSELDMVIAHNGMFFDMRMIRAFMVEAGLPPLKPIKVIDTLQLHKKAFGFSSQSLAHISPKFMDEEEAKSEHKLFPGFSMWMECLKDNPEAWRENKTYNLTDLTSLEGVYMRTRGWLQGAPNVGIYVEDVEEGVHLCDKCGSECKKDGVHRTQVGVYQAYRCKNDECRGWSRGRVLIADRAARAHVTMS